MILWNAKGCGSSALLVVGGSAVVWKMVHYVVLWVERNGDFSRTLKEVLKFLHFFFTLLHGRLR
jgi:hypothetical protein